MDEEAIRRLLGGVAVSDDIPAGPDAVAILRSRVESAGGDLQLVYENRTLSHDGPGLAASRLAPTSEMIKEKAA